MLEHRKVHYEGRNQYCGRAVFVNFQRDLVSRARCHMFSCAECRPNQISWFRRRLVDVAKEKELVVFLTLMIPSVNREGLDPDSSFSLMSLFWNLFRLKYKRLTGHGFDYVAVYRSHDNGYAHMHILLNRYIPMLIVDSIALEVGLGMTNIKYVDTHRVSWYLSRYLEKEEEWYIPEGHRHYSTSRSIVFNDYVPQDGWYYLPFAYWSSPLQLSLIHI